MTLAARRDRTARLLRLMHLLYEHHPHGLTVGEMARLCGVTRRTTYRDLRAVEEVLEAPLWQESDHWGLDFKGLLPPLKLTLAEAVALFISARLASRYSDERDRSIEGAFAKLATVMPPAIARHLQATVATIATRREDPDFCRTMEILTSAWAEQRRVRLWYPSPSEGMVHDRLVDAYFIEPLGPGHACYLIGYCHHAAEMRIFKIERVTGVELTSRRFEIPEGWSIEEYLRGAWGIVGGEEVEVRLRFSPRVAQRLQEGCYHCSQQLWPQADGSLIARYRVAGTMEISRWILSWGQQVEVLEPEQLRQEMATVAAEMGALYCSSRSADLSPAG